jgi:hypothetical protein
MDVSNISQCHTCIHRTIIHFLCQGIGKPFHIG